MQRELGRRRLERGSYQFAVDLYHLRGFVNVRAGLSEDFAGLAVEHLDTQLLDDAQRGIVDRLEAVRTESWLANQRIFQPAIIDLALMRCIGDTVMPAAAFASAHVTVLRSYPVCVGENRRIPAPSIVAR